MRITSITFDVAQLVAAVGWVLLIVGVIALTPVAVGVLGLLSMCELSFKWGPWR